MEILLKEQIKEELKKELKEELLYEFPNRGKQINYKDEEKINARIKRYRNMLGYTQENMAKLLDVSKSSYVRYEAGGKITVNMALRMAQIFNVSIENLILGVGKKENEKFFDLKRDEQKLITSFRALSKGKRQYYTNAIHASFLNHE